MFIETRFYNNGGAEVYLRKSRPVQDSDDYTGKYDFYVDEVTDLQEWIDDNLEIELDDIVSLVLDLESGKWVDISAYC